MDDILVTIIKRGRKHNISNCISKIINIQFWMPAGWGWWFFFFFNFHGSVLIFHTCIDNTIYYRPEPMFKMPPSIIIFAWWCSHRISYVMWCGERWCSELDDDDEAWIEYLLYVLTFHASSLLVYSVMDGIFGPANGNEYLYYTGWMSKLWCAWRMKSPKKMILMRWGFRHYNKMLWFWFFHRTLSICIEWRWTIFCDKFCVFFCVGRWDCCFCWNRKTETRRENRKLSADNDRVIYWFQNILFCSQSPSWILIRRRMDGEYKEMSLMRHNHDKSLMCTMMTPWRV
jgi:hypothetical protein